MQVKRYEAASMREAMGRIKKDLGPDAFVLSTKRLSDEKLIEVLAARDDGFFEEGCKTGQARGGEIIYGDNDQRGPSCQNRHQETVQTGAPAVSHEYLAREFSELKDSFHTFIDMLGLRDQQQRESVAFRIYQYLVDRGIAKTRACSILEEAKRDHPAFALADHNEALKIIEKIISRSVGKQSRLQDKRIKIFVGPTGVGKTTTLAKMAARFALEGRKRVGLITLDTFRIAAREQLKLYAGIMGLPLEVATEKASFRKAIAQFSEKDVILVDTPGKSRADSAYVNDLSEIFTDLGDLEKHLLLSTSSSRDCMMGEIERFDKLDFDNLILTKLDEGFSCGYLYDVIEQSKKPVSYITTGQNVPQDIEPMEPAKFAEIVLRS